MKNLNERATKELITKTPNGMAVQPDIMVITLNGKGVIPAIRTAQSPYALNL